MTSQQSDSKQHIAQYLPLMDHEGVTNAQNPSSFGHHHGPIVNGNINWLPSRQRQAVASGSRAPAITASDNAEVPPNSPVRLSTVNGLICDVVVAQPNIMCGEQFSTQPAFRRHLRAKHPGCTERGSRQNLSTEELAVGENALKLWVRSGGWRDALYAKEPGTGPVHGYLNQYATIMENIAKHNAAFATKYGTRFHRYTPSYSSQRHLKRKYNLVNQSSGISENTLEPMNTMNTMSRDTQTSVQQAGIKTEPRSDEEQTPATTSRLLSDESADELL